MLDMPHEPQGLSLAGMMRTALQVGATNVDYFSNISMETSALLAR